MSLRLTPYVMNQITRSRKPTSHRIGLEPGSFQATSAQKSTTLLEIFTERRQQRQILIWYHRRNQRSTAELIQALKFNLCGTLSVDYCILSFINQNWRIVHASIRPSRFWIGLRKDDFGSGFYRTQAERSYKRRLRIPHDFENRLLSNWRWETTVILSGLVSNKLPNKQQWLRLQSYLPISSL